MLRDLFGRVLKGKPKRQDPWRSLIAASPSAADEAERIIAHAVQAAQSQLGTDTSEVVLHWSQAEPTFDTVLSEIEGVLEELCGRYDYRQFLFVSRLCSGLPLFRDLEEPKYTSMRIRSADRWILSHGHKDVKTDFMRIDEGGYSIGFPPDSLFFDSVVLNMLAKFHARMVKERMVFNFMRLVSSKNQLPSPKLRFNDDGRVGWNFETANLQAAANMYVYRHDSYNATLARWGMNEMPSEGEPLALTYDMFEEVKNKPYGGGTLFVPKPLFLDTLLEYGATFRNLFERDVGMPIEHFWGICRGLYQLGIDTVSADEQRLLNWGAYTGTVPVARDDFTGGNLEDKVRQELTEAFPELRVEQSLRESVARFVDLASSSGSQPEDDKKRQGAATVARVPTYPFMIHGDDSHEYWLVDYFNTVPFLQSLVDRLEFSETNSTTGLREHDASIRTAIFDAHMAEILNTVEGVEEIFEEYREDPTLPNAKFSFDGGAQEREIDVPMRLGKVLLAVQTWATEMDFEMDAGDYRTMNRQWRKVKKKLRDTDRAYTDYFLERADGREILESEGLRYVLPIVCGPHTEPAVSFEPEFWLHYPSFDDEGQLQAPPVPRVLTPTELAYFLYNTTEEELKVMCRSRGWKV